QHLPNPSGRNQHKFCPLKGDHKVADLLREYHRRNISDRKLISKLLQAEHGIKMSEATVARRRRELGLFGSRVMAAKLPDATKRQLVLDQLANDPRGRHGPRIVKELIANQTGI
ncbi:hypothetical protein CY34DRAFT_65002, partial [Suillus luteus UH-Slu-Lm8-n1]